MNLFEKQQQIFRFGIDETSGAHLLETARWGKFLAILSMAGLALMIALGAFWWIFLIENKSAGTYYGQQQLLFLFILLVAVIVNLYPAIALLKFSNATRQAIQEGDSQAFFVAVRTLRNLLRYLGILSAVVMGLYAVIFLVSSTQRFL